MSSTTSINSIPTSTSSAIATCVTEIPGKNGHVSSEACNALYNYNPSFAAALILAIVFGSSTFFHIYQAFIYKKFKLCWVLIMGCSWEFTSFALRAAGSQNQQSIPLAFVSQVLVLLAPMWVNAFIYMVMGRMIYFLVPSQRIFGIPGIKIAMIFVWLDVVSFLTQVGGGVMIQPGGSSTTIMMGIHIYMGGIGFQELCILIFTAISIQFFRKMRALSSSNQILATKSSSWFNLLLVVYTVLALITVRIIFRMVEFASGLDPAKNPIPFHEAYFMALDALPMLVAIVLLNVVHPGRVLQGEGSEFPKGPSRKEKKEAKRVKKEEKKMKKQEKKAKKDEKKRVAAGGVIHITETGKA